MKPIYKFNNGRGGVLCNGCRTIISIGQKTEELLCTKCKEECKNELCSACQIYAAQKNSSHCSSCSPLIKHWIENKFKTNKNG